MNRTPKNISYGIIVYKIINDVPYYCLICRRDSFTYSEFIRGKYQLEDIDTIKRMLSYMTEQEHTKILSNDFDTLWRSLWLLDRKNPISHNYKKDFNQSRYKFDTLTKGYYTTVHFGLGQREKQFFKLENLIELIQTESKFIEPEWGFPKGKKNKNETPVDCAKRELLEETNISIPENGLDTNNPYEEKFIADNTLEYSHIYYTYQCSNDTNLTYDNNNIHQLSEISKIEWLNYEDAIQKIRPYNIEKKEILTKIHTNIIKKLEKVN
jgi:8-oxo-dGTP pyrophosphatase MutT (NUDIX family)